MLRAMQANDGIIIIAFCMQACRRWTDGDERGDVRR